MVANLPYDLAEDKVRRSLVQFDFPLRRAYVIPAIGDLQGLLPHRC